MTPKDFTPHCSIDRKSCETKSHADSQCCISRPLAAATCAAASAQSIPSSKYSSCAGVSVTVPSARGERPPYGDFGPTIRMFPL
jgi:hypothetical protein